MTTPWPPSRVEPALDPGTAELAAGEFSSWLRMVQSALRGDGDADVPCGSCAACCSSSQFVLIEPDEVDTRARIPAELLFPAPRMPRGHVLLGYDERGHCPMLVDGRCSIYEHRPRTCRSYDCRVLAAAGVDADADKPLIGQQVRRWQFSHPSNADAAEHEAVRAAATFIDERRAELPDEARPVNATHHALLAVDLHRLFLDRGDCPAPAGDPSPREVEVEINRLRSSRRR